MTEDEAQQKICPKFHPTALQIAFDPSDFNSEYVDRKLKLGLCVGSDCMMWEWVDAVARNKINGSLSSASRASNYPDEYELLATSGYCGFKNRNDV